MDDIAIRHLSMGRRVTDFTDTHASTFPAGSRASELIGKVNAAVTAMEEAGAKQENAERSGQGATDLKATHRATLLELMRAFNQTARGMKKLFPDVANQFAMPRTYGDQVIVNTARSYITLATPIITEFTNRGLPADSLTTLGSAIDNFVSDIDAQDEARAEQTAATAAINDAQRQLTDAVGELSPIIRNTFRKDPATLAAWESASRVERAPKKAAKKQPSSS